MGTARPAASAYEPAAHHLIKVCLDEYIYRYELISSLVIIIINTKLIKAIKIIHTIQHSIMCECLDCVFLESE